MDEHAIEGVLLRAYVGESDHAGRRPVWEELMLRAREAGLAGATVLRGIAGYGADSRIHTSRVLRLSSDLPMVVEIVDTPDAIEAFRPVVEELIGKGLVTLEHVQIWVPGDGLRGQPAGQS